MKKDNLTRAKRIGEEIHATEYNIETLTEVIAREEVTDIVIGEYSDRSGWSLKPVYHNGNYAETLHKKLLSDMLTAYENHLAILLIELESL